MPREAQQEFRIPVVVLCGGNSQRMGQDKRKILINGQTMLERTLHNIESFASEIVLVGAFQEPRLASLKHQPIEWLSDEFPNCGPAEGLRVGLKHFAQQAAAPFAFVIGCDYPLFNPEVAKIMMAPIVEPQTDDLPQAVCLSHQGFCRPLPAIYSITSASKLESLQSATDLSLGGLLRQLNVATIDSKSILAVDPNLDSLKNVNRPGDLLELGGKPRS